MSDETTPVVVFNQADFDAIRERADNLVSDYEGRKEILDAMEEMWTLDPTEDAPKAKGKTMKVTLSPDPANSVLGAWRLLCAADPVWDVPYDRNKAEAKSAAQKIEKLASIMWEAAGDLAGEDVHTAGVLSGLLFAQMDVAVILVDSLIAAAEGDDDEIARLERVKQATPVLFECWHPGNGYPERDRLGLRSYLREYDVRMSELAAQFPAAEKHLEEKAAGKKKITRQDTVTVRDLYTTQERWIWISGKTEPFFYHKHGYGFVPVVVQVTEGSRLFLKQKDQRRPFLYTVWKSGLWNRHNLALTAAYTVLFAVAVSAMFKHRSPQSDPKKRLQADFTNIVGVFEIEPGEDVEAMFSKGAIDPSMMQMVDMAERKMMESTIYRQALGEPVGANAPYSLQALLNQSGRLPLVPQQKMAGMAFGRAMMMAMAMLKREASSISAKIGMQEVQLAASEIPDDLVVSCTLEITLPQERLQMGAVASQLKAMGAASMRWIREKVFHITQSDEMDEEVLGEQFLEQMAVQFFQQMQAGPQPGVENGAPPGSVPPGGPAGIMPGSEAANMAAGAGSPQDIEARMAQQEAGMSGGNTGLPTQGVQP